MDIFNLKPKEKLTRARVQLANSHPFFAQLSMALKFVEDKNCPTMGVNKFGVCVYNPTFVDSLSQEELKGTLCHEVMHCALDHMNRGEKKEHQLYNISADLVINDMLGQNNIKLPQGALLPDYNHDYELDLPDGKKHTLKDINKRTADDVYDEIYGIWKNQKNKGNNMKQGHDQHNYGGNSSDKINKGVSNRDKDFWKNKTVEAGIKGKLAGSIPKGMERIIETMTNPKMTWKQMLQKFIRDRVPYDFSWKRPNKKTYSTGWYMPKTVKEGVTLTLLIDTSGSISTEDLGIIFGEMKGIVEQIRGLDLRVIYHDTQVYEGMKKLNPTLSDVKKEFTKAKGGGGTSFKNAYEYLEKNVKDSDMIIHATDGCDTFPNKFSLPIIILLIGRYVTDINKVKQQAKYASYVVRVKDGN